MIIRSVLLLLYSYASLCANHESLPSLATLALQHHTDKSCIAYDYADIYEQYIGHLREQPLTFLEFNAGLSGFFSRKMWDHYFTNPEAKLFFVAPHDEHILPFYQRYLFSAPSLELTPRTKTFMVNSNTSEGRAAIRHFTQGFDVIIDSSTPSTDRQIACFKTLFEHVNPGGVYIIENIYSSYEKATPLIDERSSSDILLTRNTIENPDTSLHRIHNSLLDYLDRCNDVLQYTEAKSPKNYVPEHSRYIIPDDYMKQWPAAIAPHTDPCMLMIKSITYYPNCCIITKKNKVEKYQSHPISFCIPESKIVPSIPPKTRAFAHIIPGDKKTYIYRDEQSYYQGYQEALYGITFCKVGWDCMRHYEILANGCIPYFVDLDQCHPSTMHAFPKKLILKAMNLPGVSYNHIDHAVFNRADYDAILQELLAYTRKHLTTRATARQLLHSIGYTGNKPILYLYEPRWLSEYMRDLLLIGLKEELGSLVVDAPKNVVIYTDYPDETRNLYGMGFSYTKVIDDIPVDRTRIAERIANKEFAYVIYGEAHQQLPLYDVVTQHYAQDEIVYICGSERYTGSPTTHYCGYRNKFPHVFIREWSPDALYCNTDKGC